MNIILTGCDKNTEWQLPWFIHNFKTKCAGTHCKLAITDFGMTEKAKKKAALDADWVVDLHGEDGWFNKVRLFYKTHEIFGDSNICWMDTDCEIRRCPTGIFDYIEDNKVAMCVDRPWTEHGSPWSPQGNLGPWYNSGVVAYRGRPQVLAYWLTECERGNHRGDQEALYHYLNGDAGRRFTNIVEAPAKYNMLRLDVEQGRGPDDATVMHWTGHKGKDEIKRQMAK